MPYIGQLPATGENNAFRILDDISSYVLTFDGSDASVVSTSNDTITITGAENRFLTGQRVTYSKGSGGTVITGLTDDTAYYVIRDSNTTIKLATSSSNATNDVAVDLTGVGGGTAHKITLAFDGTNTKFRTTYDSGKQDPKVTRAAQLVLSINGIIQQPIDSTSPSSGFGIDGGDIVFSTAPDANDDFWGHVLASNTVTFDISDNDIDNFTGDGSTVNFTLSKTPSDNRNVLVTLDGVVQYPSDNSTTRAYTLSENELQFVSAPALNVSIQVRHIGFAGASGSGGGGVTGFYGRTGNVVLKNTDNPVIGNLTAVDGTFSGNVSIAKTLTYMDVAHIDAVGVVTAQSGIQCLDDLNVGLGTFFVDKSTGFVGIGTIVPGRRLHVVSDEQVVGLLTSTNAANKSFLRMSDPTTTSQGTAPSIGSKGDFLELRTGTNYTRLTIDSSGNIGIGSTAPAQLLHLEKNSAFQILLKRGGGSPSEVAFKNAGNYAVISNNANGIDLQTGTTPSSSLHIDQNGRVGITTEGPARNLHIHQNTAASAYLHMTNSTTGATTTDGFSLYIATSGIVYYRARETTGQHVFYTGTTEKFRIDEDGKVGILSTSPGKTLDIIGSLQVKDTGNKIGLLLDPSTGDFQVNQSVASWTNTGVDPVALLRWGWAGATGNYMYMGSGGNDAVASQMALLISGEDGFKVGRSAWDGTNGDISATNEFFTVSKTGSVGIGTSVPAGRLEVIDSSALGIISRSATTQATDTNKGLKVRNNSTTDTFSVSYKGEGYFAGRVGIGTDDPATDIHIWDGAPNIRLTDTNPYVANRFGQIAQSGGVLQLSARGDGSEHGSIYFYNVNDSETLNAYRIADNYHSWYTANDSNSVKMRLTNGGGLGIGTISPDHLLHVYKDSDDAVVTIESTGNGNHAALEFIRTSSGGDGKGAGSIYVTGDTSASEAKMKFAVGHNVAHEHTPAMVIMGNGEVGIGTDNPLSALDVRNASETDPLLSLHHSEADVEGEVIRIGRVAPYHTIRYHSINAMHGGAVGNNYIGFSLHNGTTTSSQTEVMRVVANGRVAIGTDGYGNTSPLAPLHVSSYSPTTAVTDHNTLRGASQLVLQTSNNVNDSRSGLMFSGALHSTDGCSAGIVANHENVAENSEATSLSFYTSHTETLGERLRIDSNGTVRVGDNSSFSPHSAADNLVVGSTSGSNGLTILTGVATGTIFFNHGSGNEGVIQYIHSGTEHMRIKSEGYIKLDAGGNNHGGGVYTREKTCTTSGTNVFKFDLSHGALAGTLYAIGSNSGNSVSKVYAFAGHFGSNDLQKIADSGAYNGNNFTVTCSTSTSNHTFTVTTTGEDVEISLTMHLGSPNQDVTYTAL